MTNRIKRFFVVGDSEFWDALVACGCCINEIDDAMDRAVDAVTEEDMIEGIEALEKGED